MRVTGADVVEWGSNPQRAQGELPELVRRLLHATNLAQIEYIDIPADAGIVKPGVDGKVFARVGLAGFVPQGWSVWEMGTGKFPRGKVKKDYAKRVKDTPPGVDPKQTTFVFVTPHSFTNKGSWELERRSEAHWQDVRVLDADNLADWLQHAPSVAVWFAELTGRPGPMQSLGWRWREWSQATRLVMSEALVLAGRDDARDALLTWLAAEREPGRESSPLTLRGADADEVTAFCWAALMHLPKEQREQWQARAGGDG